MDIAIYVPSFNDIGGIETWVYYISKLYNDICKITIYYQSAPEQQLERLNKIVRTKRFYNQTIKCDKALFPHITSDNDIKCFNAKYERIRFIHACYSVAYNIKKYELSPYIDRWIAVSNVVKEDFDKLTGTDVCEVMYNPIWLPKPKKVLRLISATRISEDKGSIWQYMKKFALELEKNNIPFIWFIFTNNFVKCDIKGIVFMKPELCIIDYIKDSDYLFQYSKKEAFCLSVVESLSVGTPVIISDFDVKDEIGVVDGVNGYVLDMNLDNIDVEKIYNNIPKFSYEAPNSNDKWVDLLSSKEKKLNYEKPVTVQCAFKDGFYDNEYRVQRKYKEIWVTDLDRAKLLMNFSSDELTNVKLIDIIDNER